MIYDNEEMVNGKYCLDESWLDEEIEELESKGLNVNIKWSITGRVFR